jgi:hypothetical protein
MEHCARADYSYVVERLTQVMLDKISEIICVSAVRHHAFLKIDIFHRASVQIEAPLTPTGRISDLVEHSLMLCRPVPPTVDLEDIILFLSRQRDRPLD